MSNLHFRLATLGAATLLAALPMLGRASTIFLPRDTVVPVVFENDLSLRRARTGDRFTAHVDNDRDLPARTRLIGRIRRIDRDRDNRSVVQLEFTDAILPDGSRHDIYAIPVPLDDRYTNRRADGRIVVKEDARRKEGYVLGGALGGFVIGSIIKKQPEATVLGALAGVVAAVADKSNDGNTIVRKGQRLGMLVERDARLETYGRRGDNRYDDRYDDRRGNDRYDDRRDDRWDDRRNDRYEDRDNRDNRDNRDYRDDDRRYDDRRAPEIRFENRTVRFGDREQPYREGSTVMVPLETMLRELGLSMEKGRASAIYIEGENSTLRLEQGSTEARLNGRRVDLPRSVVEREGVIYVPVEILASIKRGNLAVDGNRIEPKTY